MGEHDFSQLRILIVDDNRHFIAVIRAMLRALGVRHLLEASDSFTALDLINRFEVDLALIDLKIDDTDGIELARLIRSAEHSRNARVPIIMVTAFSERSKVAEAINAGIDDFLLKPVSAKTVYKRLVWLLGNPRPYVKYGSYFGPDRRRRQDPKFGGLDRRKSAKLILDDTDSKFGRQISAKTIAIEKSEPESAEAGT